MRVASNFVSHAPLEQGRTALWASRIATSLSPSSLQGCPPLAWDPPGETPLGKVASVGLPLCSSQLVSLSMGWRLCPSVMSCSQSHCSQVQWLWLSPNTLAFTEKSGRCQYGCSFSRVRGSPHDQSGWRVSLESSTLLPLSHFRCAEARWAFSWGAAHSSVMRTVSSPGRDNCHYSPGDCLVSLQQ